MFSDILSFDVKDYARLWSFQIVQFWKDENYQEYNFN